MLALTIPELGPIPQFGNEADIQAARDELNKQILAHNGERFNVFDLGKAVPLYSLSKEEKELLWNDPIHYSAAGYARMGREIGEALLGFMRE